MTLCYIKKNSIASILILIFGIFLILPTNSINANTPPIELIDASATSEFPKGIRFKVKATSTSEIESIAVRFKIGLITTGIYEYLSYDAADTVEAELFYSTNPGFFDGVASLTRLDPVDRGWEYFDRCFLN